MLAIRLNLQTYRDLFASRGLRLVFSYFVNSHLYDLLRKVDTHLMLRKESLLVDSANLEHSQMYMVSWTSTVKKSFKEAICRFDLSGFVFIDLGCGKGKAVLLARELSLLGGDVVQYIGIDFVDSLVQIARNNSRKLFGDEGNFIVKDAIQVEWDKLPKNVLIFMYNPFDAVILDRVLSQIVDKQVISIYVNPVHQAVFQAKGYSLLYEKRDWHANLNFSLMTNIQEISERQ